MKKNKDYDEKSRNDETHDDISKKVVVIVSVGVAFIIIVAIAVSVFLGINAYKKPVNDIIKGINKADTLMLMESMYPEEIITVNRINKKNEGTAWKDYLKQNDDYIESKMEEMHLEKAKCEVIAKERISGSNLDEIEKFYNTAYESEVKKAYRVEVNMTFKIDGSGNETPSGWICVVKLKDEGWKFCPEYSEKHFDFIDEAIKFQ